MNLPPDERARAALKVSIVEGMLHATMVGVAESYLGALAVELGHRDGALALLATIPLLLGSSGQLLASPMLSWLGSRKRLVVLGAGVQALTHLAFALGPGRRIRFDRSLRVGVSARSLRGHDQRVRRMDRAWRTLRLNWRDEPPWDRWRARLAQLPRRA